MNQTHLTELEALASHYPNAARTPEMQRRWLKDYLEALSPYGDDAVARACRDWKHDPASTRFPTIGQILALARRHTPSRASIEKAEPWKPPTDEEYAAMPLREKIRQQRILASAARHKAGPMWSRGKPLHPDQMPDAWWDQQQIAHNHDAEAARLSEILNRSKAHA